MYTYTYIFLYVCMYVCMYIYICICIQYLYVCSIVFITLPQNIVRNWENNNVMVFLKGQSDDCPRYLSKSLGNFRSSSHGNVTWKVAYYVASLHTASYL